MVALFAALMLGSPTVVATINTGLRPCGSAAFGKYLYVDNYGAGTMSRKEWSICHRLLGKYYP